MPAKKKKTVVKKKKTITSRSSSSLWESYTRERDEFYSNHPYARMLLGVLIVAFAISIGALYYNKNVIYIGLTLDEYGIRYPYIPTVK